MSAGDHTVDLIAAAAPNTDTYLVHTVLQARSLFLVSLNLQQVFRVAVCRYHCR